MIFTILLASISVVVSQEYSFCSGDNLYSFSGQLCPGGVLLKEAIKIDEPCFCFGADLKIYEDCNTDSILKTATFPGCEAPLIQASDNWTGKAKFFLSTDNFTQKAAGEYEFCPKIRDTCVRLDEGNFTGLNISGINGLSELAIDDINQLRQIRQGKQCSVFDGPGCEDDKTPMIKEIVAMLTYIQNKERFTVISNMMKLLKMSVEIFKALAPDWMVPDTTMDTIFDIFHLKYTFLDGYITDKHMPENTYMELKHQLEKCLSDTKELTFMQDKSTCPPQVGNLMHVNEELGQSESLSVEIPADRMYKKDEEDLLIGVLWKVVDTIHTKCFHYNHYYFTNMEDIFLSPPVQNSHYDKSGYRTLLYAGVVDHDDLQVFMQNVDKIDGAVHAIAKDKVYFKKPRRESDMAGGASRRLKRTTDTETKYIEIWGGRAYCFLQKNNFTNITNHPVLKKMCEETKIPKAFQCVPSPLKEEALKNVSMNCSQVGEGLENQTGIFRLENNVVESCCYVPKNCNDTDPLKCIEECKQFCGEMKSQYLSSENLKCKCTHSEEFVKFNQNTTLNDLQNTTPNMLQSTTLNVLQNTTLNVLQNATVDPLQNITGNVL